MTTEKGGLYFCVYICEDNVNTAKLWYYCFQLLRY